MSGSVRIAYLTSLYARASDSFVRAEVRELRAAGHSVRTFSIRRPARAELVTDEIRAEHDRTDYILDGSRTRLVAAGLRSTRHRLGRGARAAALAARIGWPGARGRLWPFAYLLEAAYLAERLQEHRVQHLHDHIGEGSAAVAMLASQMAGIPYSFTVHGPSEFDHPHNLALDQKVARASFCVTISDYTRGQMMRWSRPADWPRIHVVRCGIERSMLEAPALPPPSAPRLVCVGRLAPAKGHEVLLHAVAQLTRDGIPLRLRLIGDGPLRKDLERTVSQLGLSHCVQVLGWASREEVAAEMRAARAVVVASFAEGLPVTIIEALALGRPVIATRVGAIPELVEAGRSGWLVNPGSVEELASAMREALEAPEEELTSMGVLGRVSVMDRHDATAAAARLAELFASSAAGHAPRG